MGVVRSWFGLLALCVGVLVMPLACAPVDDDEAAVVDESPLAQTNPTVTVSATKVDPNATVTVHVRGGPADPANFLEIYQVLGTCGDYTCWKWLGQVKYLNGATTKPTTGLADADVAWQMPSTVGVYAFYFRFNSTTPDHVQSPYVGVGVTPISVGVSATSVGPGQSVTVQLRNGPGDPGNFLEAYQVLGTCGDYKCWKWLGQIKYLDGSTTKPTTGRTSADVPWVMPTTAGTYAFYFRYSTTNSDHVQSATVVVTGSGTTPAPTTTTAPPPPPAPIPGGAFNPPYPRLASYRIGGTQIYNATFQAWAAKQSVVVIGGNWEGWANSGRNRETVVKNIHAMSTFGTKVLQYGLPDVVYPGSDNMPTFTAQINANNWYLWQKGSGPNHVIADDVKWYTNSTNAVASNAKGQKLEDAFAVYTDFTYRTAGTPNAAASLDGHYHDNTLFKPRYAGDFDRNGTSDTEASAGLAWRTGLRRYFDQLKAINPNLIRFANLDDMYSLGSSDANNTSVAAPLDGGILNGALMEGFLGKPYALESFSTWAASMAEYKFRMNMTSAPKLVVMGHGPLTATGTDPYTATPYQAMRYGLASTLLDDGYYAWSPDGYPDNDNTLFWFDEFGGAAGGPALGYLGYPTQGPPTAAYQNGVWRRDFEHGIVLVNPKGNGTRTVTLGGTFKHLKGNQNPSLNNGSAVTSVTLQARDGLILLR